MKFKNLIAVIIVAATMLITLHADVQAPAYNTGDLFLGFRSTNSSQCYIVNIGQASQFTGVANAFTLTGIGNIADDLVTVFGNDWNANRADMRWGVFGASDLNNVIGNDPAKTLYATRARTSPGTQSTPWTRASDSAQGTTTNFMKTLASAYITYSGTASSAGKGVIQNNSDINSYASYQPGGTVENAGPAPGTSFQAFNPTIESTFSTGVSDSVLDLFRMAPSSETDQPGDYLGTFTIAANGALTFTPITSTPGTLVFSSSTFTSAESATTDVVKTITLKRAGGSLGAASVEVTIADGSAVTPDDYTSSALVTLNWADGDIAEKSFNITIKTDGNTEGSETVFLDLQNTTGASLGNITHATLTITDPPVPGIVAFDSATYSQTEPASGTADMTITVKRTGGSDGAVSVEATVTGETATAGDDFVASAPVTLNWADGDSTSKSFTITVKTDALVENDETINLVLQNNTGGVAIDPQNTAIATIHDQPPPSGSLSFSGSTFSKTEDPVDDTAMTITVNRTGGSAGAASVEVAVNPVNASNPADYTVASPVTLNWADGDSAPKTFDITIKSDAEAETNETFSLSLQNPTVATLGTQKTATGIISDGTVVIPLAELGGSYNGLVTGPAAQRGLINVMLTPTGTFTGKVTIEGITQSISGTFTSAGAARFGTTFLQAVEIVKKAKPANISKGFLALNLNVTGGHWITGTLMDQTGTTALGTIQHADRALYTSTANPVTPFKNVPTTLRDPLAENGKYTAIFAANAAPNNGVVKSSFPQGDGFGSISISKGGIVKILGKLADGSVITYANALSRKNEWPVFVQLYKKKGYIAGNVAFEPTQPQTDAACAGMKWFKPDTTALKVKDKLYPAGWPGGITTDFIGSKYFIPTKPTALNPTPPNTGTVLGNGVPGAPDTATANIIITTADRGLTTNTSNDASLSAKNKVTVLGATSGSTAAPGLKITFTPKTGKMSGIFTHPGRINPVKYTGVTFQKTNTASGYFLYFPTKTAPVGTPAESGAVGVAKK